jgi:4-hydroxy-tetrahydrodipicolinate synthase
MMNDLTRRINGIHAATLVPFDRNYRVDEAALADHLRSVAYSRGIRGLLVNGHAGENFVLSLEEKRAVMRIARAVAPPECFIVSGVNQESSIAAAAEAATMESEGADALLVFPPNSWALGQTKESVLLHHQYIRDATSLPILIYGAPVTAGAMAYPVATVEALAHESRIIGIKEGSWEIARYEENLRMLKMLRPDFIVLGSGDEHLLASYLIGSAGSQVSLAALVPETVCALWDAASAHDWSRARCIHERLYPLSVATYRNPPAGRASARLKAGLKILGRLSDARVRPPLTNATAEEYRSLELALTSVFEPASAG